MTNTCKDAERVQHDRKENVLKKQTAKFKGRVICLVFILPTWVMRAKKRCCLVSYVLCDFCR